MDWNMKRLTQYKKSSYLCIAEEKKGFKLWQDQKFPW